MGGESVGVRPESALVVASGVVLVQSQAPVTVTVWMIVWGCSWLSAEPVPAGDVATAEAVHGVEAADSIDYVSIKRCGQAGELRITNGLIAGNSSRRRSKEMNASHRRLQPIRLPPRLDIKPRPRIGTHALQREPLLWLLIQQKDISVRPTIPAHRRLWANILDSRSALGSDVDSLSGGDEVGSKVVERLRRNNLRVSVDVWVDHQHDEFRARVDAARLAERKLGHLGEVLACQVGSVGYFSCGVVVDLESEVGDEAGGKGLWDARVVCGPDASGQEESGGEESGGEHDEWEY